MKPNAIAYTSNTGYTEQYALLLGEQTGLPVYTLEDAGKNLAPGGAVIYLGWLMAGKVKGLKKARARYDVKAVCAVGMGPETGGQTADISAKNPVGNVPLFYLQGGFDMARLKGIYRFMMKAMQRTIGSKLESKQDITAEERDMLDMINNGRDCVNPESLAKIKAWLKEL